MTTYKIKEVAAMFDLPSSTLRYYEEVGLLTNIKRHKTQRIFEDCHINRLKTICCFKETGMTIAQLQEFFRCEDQPGKEGEIVDLLQQQTRQVTKQIEELKKNQAHIKRKLAFYHDLQTARQNDQTLPDWQTYKKQDFAED